MFSNTVNVAVDAINCHGCGRAIFRPHIDRVFMARQGRHTRCDAGVLSMYF